MGIGRVLSDILKEKNTTVKDLSRDIGVPPTTIYSIIDRDNMKIDISVLIKICKALNVDINIFYKDYLSAASIKTSINVTDEEEKILNQIRGLDDYGKRVIEAVLKIEYERCKGK